MSAYVISEVDDVRDPAEFEVCRSLAAKAIAHYGGRYLIRAGAANLIEGGPPPKKHHCRRISHDGAFARMVRLAGIRGGAERAADRVRSAVDLR
jgi:uncharacterized protein (DUF1330 family)